MSRPRRLKYGPLLRGFVSHLKVAAWLLEQSELILPSVLGLLVPDVLTDHFFVPTHGRDEEAAGPEVLPNEVAFPLAERSSDMDRALARNRPPSCILT